jgi:DNA-binding NarL/FixJ family response regulator
MDARYWEKRLFRNTFTYRGRTRQVNGWCVKIQLFGRRHTFSLGAAEPPQAALEACWLYQTIQTQGWDAVKQPHAARGFRAPVDPAALAAPELSEDYWQKRLVRRKYPEQPGTAAERELSVRIEHGGTSRYFPLGTNKESKAAALAMRIYESVTREGWAVANQKFVRELTLGMRWQDNPLAWTYTTLHTLNTSAAEQLRPAAGKWCAAVLEPDHGLRAVLVSAINTQERFACCGAYASTAEAERELRRQRIELLAVNFALPDQPGASALEELRKIHPGLAGVLYSVYEDSDELFKATPGGSLGYLLKRTTAQRILDPLAPLTGKLTVETIALRVREYFQQLVSALPAGTSSIENARLTPRENEILAYLARGHVAKEIADALGISIWTVHGHIKSVFEKLGVHTRTEAVLKFLQK